MDKKDSRYPNYGFTKVLTSLSRLGRAFFQLSKGFVARVAKRFRGPDPEFIAHLSLRMDLLAYCDTSGEIKRYRIRKNGNFPSRIDLYDSLHSVTFSRPSEKMRQLLTPPPSDGSILHDGVLWGWTPDGAYLRVLIGDVSMLLTFEEAASLRKAVFPRNTVSGERLDG